MGGRSVRWEIEGLRETRRAMRVLGDDFKSEMKATHTAAAEVVARRARYLTPSRTGTLTRSVRAAGTTTRGQVKAGTAGVRYAGPVHFGWPGRPNKARGWRGGPIRPQPFIYEAADDRIGEVVDVYEERVRDLIRRHGLTGRL